MKHPFLHRSRVVVAVCASVVLLLPAILGRPKYEKYATQWETDGAFAANGRPNPRDFPSRVLRSADARFWRNYTPAKGTMPAELQSAPFVLRSNRVIIPLIGFQNSEEAGIYLESETDHQRFGIRDGVLHKTILSAGGEGFDEMDDVSGDGSAELLDDGSIEIEFAYHNGDEAVLKAKLDTSSTVC